MKPYASNNNNISAQYFITHGIWRHDYEVSGSRTFHVDNSALRPGKPDLTFHAGSDSTAPIEAVCKFRHFSSDTEIGLRDPLQSNSMSWERLSRQGLIKVQYGFRMNVGDRQPRTFTWKSTQSMGTGRTGNLKLVDESTQQVVAVFSSGSSLSKRAGQLDIYDIYANDGDRFHLMVLTTGLAVRERLRRSSNTASVTTASSGSAAIGGAGLAGF